MTHDDACHVCGKLYRDFRCGLDFAEAQRQMRTPGPPPWRQRRRHGVLGFMHETKVRLFALHIQECEHHAGLGWGSSDDVQARECAE
jgi:hypothetical protein